MLPILIIPNDFSRSLVKDCAVPARCGEILISLHRKSCIGVHQIIVSSVYVRCVLNPLDVIAVAVELNGIIVDDDIPISEDTLCDLVDNERFNLLKCISI